MASSEVAISAAPKNGSISGVTIKRDGDTLDISYKIPSNSTSTSNKNRVENASVIISMNCDKQKKVSLYKKASTNPKRTAWSYTHADHFYCYWNGLNTSFTKKFDRSRYHPCGNNKGRYCKSITVGVRPWNAKGEASSWSESQVTFKFEKPATPTITLSYDTSAKKMKYTIKSDKGTAKADRYDTEYRLLIDTAEKGGSAKSDPFKVLQDWKSDKKLQIDGSYDISKYLSDLAKHKDNIRFKVEARNRGMWGNSNTESKTYNVGYPLPATIKDIKLLSGKKNTEIEAGSATSGDLIKIQYTLGQWTKKVQLQRSHAGSGNWVDVSNAADTVKKQNDTSTVFTFFDSYGDAEPVPGEYIYYRIKSVNEDFVTYSSSKIADKLYVAKSKAKTDATMEFVYGQPGDTSDSIKIVMGFSDVVQAKEVIKTENIYNNSGVVIGSRSYEGVGEERKVYPNVGTELSYSSDAKVWDALNLEPTIIDLTTVDQTIDKTAKNLGYSNSQTVIINGLESNTDYYFRMRRYRYGPNTTEKIYSEYKKKTIKTSAEDPDKCGIVNVTEVPHINPQDHSQDYYDLTVLVGINEKRALSGTELSWSESKAAWDSSSAGYSSTEYNVSPVDATGDTKKSWKKQVSLTISNITVGKTLYIRARRYTQSGSGSKVYTGYSNIFSYSTSSADNDTCIVIPSPLDGGTVAKLTIDVDEDNVNTGTQIQWSDYENAWESNVQPDSINAEWPLVNRKQTVYIRNLTPGRQYWVQARRYLASGNLTTYGLWSGRKTFITPRERTTVDAVCEIVSAAVDASGTGATIVLGYTESNPNIATELSWSTDEKAWTSNKLPTTMDVDWTDEKAVTNNFKVTQTVFIRDLELNKTYYFKARRYNEDSSGKTYTPYSPVVIVNTPAKSENLDIRCGMLSLVPVNDGVSAMVVIGWTGDHTGCEISWSDDERSWNSSESPDMFNFDWEDEENRSGSYVQTTDQAIDSSKTYYIKDENDEFVEVETPVAADLDKYYEFTYLWPHTGTCFIKGLTEGVSYYVRARSYYEGDSGTSYSDYTTDGVVTPIAIPNSVVLSSYESVMRGEAIECWWSIESEMDQTEWQIHTVDYSVDPPLYNTAVAVASGEGSLCRTSLSPDIYGDATTFSFYVDASCGGGFASSEPITVGIVSAPSCEIGIQPTLTAQPETFEVYTDTLGSGIIATCYAEGIISEYPDGPHEQYSGDSIWTFSDSPAWQSTTWENTIKYSQLQEEYYQRGSEMDTALAEFHETSEWAALEAATEALYSLPEGDPGYEEAYAAYEEAYETAYSTEEGIAAANAVARYSDILEEVIAHPSDGAVYKTVITMPISDLRDEASYTIRVKTIESLYNRLGNEADGYFTVAYSHQAPIPSESITVVPNADERSAVITLAPPANAAETDVYDIYRMTPERYELVASGLPLDAIVEDKYPPFGHSDLAYRIATRTADGDIDWLDFDYVMKVYVLRFDWGSEFVELPWNIGLTKSHKKNFEGRAKIDGAIHGRWDPDVAKTGNYTTQIIRVTDSALLRQLENMGDYPGAIWVRDGYGQGMECNADLSNIQIDNRTLVVSLSIDVTRVKITDEFMAEQQSGEPDVEEEEG